MKKNSALWWARMLFSFAVLAVFLIAGFTQSEPCNGIDITTLYCAMHPLTALDKTGIIFFVAGSILFSGIWSLFIDEDKVAWNNSWLLHIILLLVCIAGLTLIYMQ